jgi:hypothetical protein
MSALTDALFSSALAQQLLTRASFPDRTQLHCAVSGGADSLALLALATRTERHVSVWHVDHGLRAESADEFAFVRSICEQLNVECTLRSVEVAPGRFSRSRVVTFTTRHVLVNQSGRKLLWRRATAGGDRGEDGAAPPPPPPSSSSSSSSS